MIVGLRAMARKKIKLEEEAIGEILVADTTLELGAEASNVVEDYFKEEEEEGGGGQASSEFAITNTGQRTRLTAKERAHNAPDVMWACAWCLVSWNITQK
jgi:hypothetical protein